MKASKRILLVGVAIELMLAALGYFLVIQLASGALKPTTTVADASSTILSVLGSVMGGLAGLLAVVYVVLRRRGS